MTRKTLFFLFALSLFSLFVSLYRLGSRDVPKTFWEPQRVGETVLVDLGETRNVGRISCFFGLPRESTYRIEYSEDGVTWRKGPEMKPDWVFRWEHVDGPFSGRYFRIVVEQPRGMLGEMAFFEAGSSRPLPIASVTALSASEGYERLFDEQAIAQYERSYLTGTYFDEIYHARTAFEHLHRLPPYEWTHPPLGKLIIALGVALFGMNPFGWRVMGVVFGALLVPVVFFLARLFVEERYALFASALFAFDFMRFVQARIATIDTYVVFFVLLAFLFLFRYFLHGAEDREGLRLLFLSGLFFGLGAATKWTAVYAGLGMAVLFVVHHGLRARKNPLHGRHFLRRVFPFAMLFFLFIPACLYFLSYIPYLLVPGHSLRDIFRYQLSMYRYHHDLKATHPFASPFWEWPVMARPIWLYKGEGLPKGYISSIVSFGNPALWWIGGITVLFALVTPAFLKRRGVFWILVAFFSQYVPWMLVPRITFIYHYYGCVPFLAVLLGVFFAWLEEDNPRARIWRWVLLGGAVVLFALFYPILSGLPVSRAYVARFLRWFPSWTFFSGGE
ncbi:glycosyltransferase family 39 protein [Candidatus Caldatribacterium sp. SIUC1]|uniref:glycosyltransferase family 39 protein n=1 Tax=Candidatus Caldatribacterium sp. SIUC1 TaxID=3418365 RepID=UPI003F68F292